MHLTFTSEPRDNDGVTERDFALDEIPGILWTPEPSSTPAPLILLGHPGDPRRMQPRLAALDLFDARGTALRYRRLSGWGPGRRGRCPLRAARRWCPTSRGAPPPMAGRAGP